jgi:hypothetical protein
MKVFNNTMVHETKITRKKEKNDRKDTYIVAIKEINMQCGNY